ncbi:MAG TPA: carbohydrate kinase family protein [Steroidobacteraceae bacterium]|nr:carbohydrate kinase family protein [Steroidobacteraceae bacterium]
MSALICGSIAFDTVMAFPGRFRDHILPDKIHMLNVSFLAPEMRRNFGGCAGNIAFNLKMLDGEGYIMATAGHDFAPYRKWLHQCGLDLRYVREVISEFTAQAYITTDADNNQITAFHPGAMNHSHRNEVPGSAGITIGIVAPDGRDGMIQHAAQFAAARIPFIFDPGQGLPMFSGPELAEFVRQASWVTVNDYEAQLLQDRIGRKLEDIARGVQALVVTRGGEGSTIHAGGKSIEVPVASVARLSDPTGCGDAYRAGLLHGLMKGYDWPVTGRIASLMGAIKIESHGTQNHRFTPTDFRNRYRETFGADLP